MIPKLNKDIRREENYRAICLESIGIKVLNRTPVNKIQKYRVKWSLSWEWNSLKINQLFLVDHLCL